MSDHQESPSKFAADAIGQRPVIHEITVVIPTLGRPILRECLDSILSGSHWPERLILVDQGVDTFGADSAKSLCDTGLTTECVRLRTRGIPIALNAGIEAVQTRYLAVTHDDCIVDRDWLLLLTKNLCRNPDAIITGRVDPGGDQMELTTNTSPVPAVYTRAPFKKEVLCPNNMGFTQETFRTVGAFDENPLFRHSAEDIDWAYRAFQSHVPIHYVPEVVVKHMDWRDDKGVAATYRVYARGQGAFYGKYIRRLDWFIALRTVRNLLSGPWFWFRGVITGNRWMMLKGRAYTTDLLPGIITGLRNHWSD